MTPRRVAAATAPLLLALAFTAPLRAADAPAATTPGGPHPTGLPNLLHAAPGYYTGGQPHGHQAFAELARLGVRTVVSVDGARPDVESARRHGLRYVHIPIGYDGIAAHAGHSIARLVRDADGPFYIHCHHGHHRGPAAAALACIAAGTLTPHEALALLQRAGTSRSYAGLWRGVQHYRPPAEDADLPELVEVADAGSLATAMAQIDRALDHLRLCRDAGWVSPADHPDLVPAHQALLLKEGLRESARNLAGPQSEEFLALFAEAHAAAQALEDALNTDAPAVDSHAVEATRRLNLLRQSCNNCHQRHRD